MILVSNDDGFRAPGIEVLAAVAAEFGEVLVCAPADERSGMSHAISLRSALRADRHSEGVYSVSGTPVDCVYLAALHLCPRPPTLVLSGINAGYNLGSDVFYSGTIGAAREGVFRGATGLGVSVEAGADPAVAGSAIRRLVPRILERHAKGARELLNLNVPAVAQPDGEIHITRLGQRRYREQVEHRADLQGKSYYWIGGPPDLAHANDRVGDDTHTIRQGVASLTPLSMDVTDDSGVCTWTKLIS